MLKDLRQKHNYTEQYVAYKLNINQSTYSRIERGKIELSYSKAKRLAEVYDKSISEIMEEYGNEKR